MSITLFLKMIGIAAALCAITASAVAAQSASRDAASSYPSRPIRLVVPVPAGGSSDGSRVAAQRLTDTWGQQVLVDKK